MALGIVRPQLPTTTVSTVLGRPTVNPEDPARIRARVQPIFTATRLGDPGYFQLRLDCDEQIRRGGSDSGEMGAFQMLHTRQREDNLRAGLDEYIRLGYAAGIFFLT